MKRGDYAYIPGSGPEDKYCRACSHIKPVSDKNGRCYKAAELRRTSLLRLDTIPLHSQACKFFQERAG